MNGIWSSTRNNFTVKGVETIMFLKINGPPPSKFVPNKFVFSWLVNHRGPTDQNRLQLKKQNNDETEKSKTAVSLFC